MWATHNRAGDIQVIQGADCGLTITAIITTYTKASSTGADRDSLLLDWGDGSTSFLVRTNGPNVGGVPSGENIGNDIKKNVYRAEHTYPGRATYVLSTEDPNRIEGIKNITNSINVRFFLTTTYTFLNPQFQGCNSTPQLLQPPIDNGCVGQRFIHNPNAFDQDGDSLAYFLGEPLIYFDTPVNGYRYPDEILPGPNNQLTLDPITGDLVWDAPQEEGDYNVVIIIVEYRNGVAIDTMIRDMQIQIQSNCNNLPPTITAPDEICVIAGELIEFDVIGDDMDAGQLVRLSALGGPFDIADPASLDVPTDFESPPVTGKFTWQTTCNHISNQYYYVVFKAEDNFQINDRQNLSTLKTVRIKVTGPPPLDLTADADKTKIILSWESPYSCEDADDGYFRTFSVWRRLGKLSIPFDTCDPGLANKGYTRISFDASQLVNNRYYYEDVDVERGRTYCYRVVAEFAKISLGGFPYNPVESHPSDEVCTQLSRDVPLITTVSVDNTAATGSIQVVWTKPVAEELDTLVNMGVYAFELRRSDGLVSQATTVVPAGGSMSASFAQANDTTYLDEPLNTISNGYTYAVAFYANDNEEIGVSEVASSIFLTVIPTDRTNQLSWQELVPWDNIRYSIFRKDPSSTTFDSLTTVQTMSYDDTGLINGEEYCYFIRGYGTYGIASFSDTLINDSQQACGVPIDDVAPCPIHIAVDNLCMNIDYTSSLGSESNHLLWDNPTLTCDHAEDITTYNIYYAPVQGDPLQIIDIVSDPNQYDFYHKPAVGIAGCYAVTAIDDNGNESVIDSVVCVDICPDYRLPNAFTPNGDGANERFIPYPYRFVSEIDIKIYNRWGELIWQTNDPDINWDGYDMNGKEVPSGSYYFLCRVFEQRLAGVVENSEILNGYIELIR